MAEKRNFNDISKKILQQSFFTLQNKKLEHKEIMAFWGFLNDKQNAYNYICELIKLIAQIEKERKIAIAANKSLTLENLLCTLFAVSMFKEFEKKNELSSFKEKECSNLQRSKIQEMTCPHTISMIETFFQVHSESSEPNYLSNLIGQICFFPDLTKQNLDTFNQESQIINHLQNYYKQLESYNHQVQQESPAHYQILLLQENQLQETGEFSYAYEYFWKIMKQKKRVVPRVVFDIIVRYFKVLPQIAKEYPDQAEKSILCLLHLTKQIITFFGVRENESIRTVLSQVQIFRRWPYPVGNMAQELVTLLFSEYKSNGNAFRYKVREEIPSVDIFSEEQAKQNQINNPQSMIQSHQAGQKSRDHTIINIPPSKDIVQQNQMLKSNSNYNNVQSTDKLGYKAYVIADKDQYEINFLIQLNRMHENGIQNSHVLRTALVTNMLSLAKETHSDVDIAQTISKKKKKDIFTIYCQLLQIIDKNNELDDWDYIRNLQERQFSKIVKFISETKNEDEVSDDNILKIITENPSTFIPQYPNIDLDPIVPYVKQPIFSKQATYKQNPTQNQIEENQIFQSYYPLLNDQDMKQSEQQFSERFLKNFSEKYFDFSLIQNKPQYQEPHRFVVMGGDAELHGLVQVLGEFFDDKGNKLLNQLDLRVYVVPTKKNTLAHYLASKDAWYQRYLYLPFREDLILPRFEKSDEGNEKDPYQFNDQNEIKANTLLPQELKLEVLNTYIREANRAFNVRVYKIHCTFANQTHSVIYFCQYLEIGESVKAELIQRQKNPNKKENHQTLYEMKEKNQIKFGGVNLKIALQSVDYLGNKWDKETYEECFSSVKVNNVYKEYFEGNTPFPNSHWLEFTCITQENSKLFDNNLRNKHLFKTNQKDSQSGVDQVQAAFKALFTSIPVESLEIKMVKSENRSESTFQILVDGKIFQGLTEIKVEPVNLTKEDPQKESKNNPHIFLSLPVMTFLPLKL